MWTYLMQREFIAAVGSTALTAVTMSATPRSAAAERKRKQQQKKQERNLQNQVSGAASSSNNGNSHQQQAVPIITPKVLFVSKFMQHRHDLARSKEIYKKIVKELPMEMVNSDKFQKCNHIFIKTETRIYCKATCGAVLVRRQLYHAAMCNCVKCSQNKSSWNAI